MAKTDAPKPVTLGEIQQALLAKRRSKECTGQGPLAIAQWPAEAGHADLAAVYRETAREHAAAAIRLAGDDGT